MALYSIRLDEASEEALARAARSRKVTRAVILREAIAEYGKAACLKALERLKEPLGTVWPALTEAVYLVRRWPRAQDEILNLVATGALRVLALGREDMSRVRALMDKHRDLPMDLADAAVVRVAEREHTKTIFTIDRRDFSL